MKQVDDWKQECMRLRLKHKAEVLVQSSQSPKSKPGDSVVWGRVDKGLPVSQRTANV